MPKAMPPVMLVRPIMAPGVAYGRYYMAVVQDDRTGEFGELETEFMRAFNAQAHPVATALESRHDDGILIKAGMSGLNPQQFVTSLNGAHGDIRCEFELGEPLMLAGEFGEAWLWQRIRHHWVLDLTDSGLDLNEAIAALSQEGYVCEVLKGIDGRARVYIEIQTEPYHACQQLSNLLGYFSSRTIFVSYGAARELAEPAFLSVSYVPGSGCDVSIVRADFDVEEAVDACSASPRLNVHNASSDGVTFRVSLDGALAHGEHETPLIVRGLVEDALCEFFTDQVVRVMIGDAAATEGELSGGSDDRSSGSAGMASEEVEVPLLYRWHEYLLVMVLPPMTDDRQIGSLWELIEANEGIMASATEHEAGVVILALSMEEYLHPGVIVGVTRWIREQGWTPLVAAKSMEDYSDMTRQVLDEHLGRVKGVGHRLVRYRLGGNPIRVSRKGFSLEIRLGLPPVIKLEKHT